MASTADIPIIDLSGDRDTVAGQLVDAAEDHGFIYIKNLGQDIPAADIDGAFAVVSEKKERKTVYVSKLAGSLI